MSSQNQNESRKCFCAKCFMPIENNDKVEINGQNFHKNCSMCCVCRIIPSSIKLFYGHVFCNDCFKTHILHHFKEECPKVPSNGWWMQWGPYCYGNWEFPKGTQSSDGDNKESPKNEAPSEERAKKCFCIRCLQMVDEDNKVVIDGKNFHKHCARCCMCNTTPKSLKIYYGQVFCEECFNRHITSPSKDVPAEFFKTCFEQWQCNPQFVESMKQFMASSSNGPCPSIFVAQGSQPPFSRCGGSAQDWFPSEPKKSATMTPLSFEDAESVTSWNLSCERLPQKSVYSESSKNMRKLSTSHGHVETALVKSASEKIGKLTKFLQDGGNMQYKKQHKWRNIFEKSEIGVPLNWSNKRINNKIARKDLKCPKCLWQECCPIYIKSGDLPVEYCFREN